MLHIIDLPTLDNGTLLRCPRDGREYSARRGDYFRADPNTIMRCPCGASLELVRKRIVYERVND
jgi:hypothetical protein